MGNKNDRYGLRKKNKSAKATKARHLARRNLLNCSQIENSTEAWEISNNVLDIKNEITSEDDPLQTSDNEMPFVEQQVPKLKQKLSTTINNGQIKSRQTTLRNIAERKLEMRRKYYDKKLALMEREVIAKENIAVALFNLARDGFKDT